MEYKPHKKQAEFHRAILGEDRKRVVLLWGRQVGKTVSAVNQAWMSGVCKQGRYMIVFPQYRQAKDTIWNQYLHYIPKGIIANTNSTDLIITLKHITNPATLKDKEGNLIGRGEAHNPDLPPSTIELKGSEDADKLRGMKAQGIIFDEYAIQDPEHWETVFQPMLTTTNGWAAFISTPKGFNHFYDMVRYAESHPDDWMITKATWRDNPSVSKEFIDTIRKEAEEKGNLSAYMQEYELEFRSVEGAVYPEFNRDVHVVQPSEIPAEGTVYAGIDFGWAEDHPTAVVFVLIDANQDWYVFDEICVSKTKLDDTIEIIKQKLGDKRLVSIVGDSARPDLIDYMASKGMPIVPAHKTANSVASGIQLLGQMLQPREQLIGKPKPKLYFSSVCKKGISQMEGYKYNSKKMERKVSEQPIKNNDDIPDALRYLLLHMKYGMIKDERLPEPSLKFNSYGLPL